MFGKRLKELRKEKGLTQKELAEKLNRSTSTIGMCETEKREPSADLLSDCAKFFEVTTDYLLGLTNQKYFKAEDTISFHTKKNITDKDLKMLRNIVDAYIDGLDDKDR